MVHKMALYWKLFFVSIFRVSQMTITDIFLKATTPIDPVFCHNRVNIQFKGHLVSFGYSERMYELCGFKFCLCCPMDNTIN